MGEAKLSHIYETTYEHLKTVEFYENRHYQRKKIHTR